MFMIQMNVRITLTPDDDIRLLQNFLQLIELPLHFGVL